MAKTCHNKKACFPEGFCLTAFLFGSNHIGPRQFCQTVCFALRILAPFNGCRASPRFMFRTQGLYWRLSSLTLEQFLIPASPSRIKTLPRNALCLLPVLSKTPVFSGFAHLFTLTKRSKTRPGWFLELPFGMIRLLRLHWQPVLCSLRRDFQIGTFFFSGLVIVFLQAVALDPVQTKNNGRHRSRRKSFSLQRDLPKHQIVFR